ncbi:phage protein GemA/Gp16 family protein [Ralstonia sp.]|uniref:phage protein GemA/Gp16 family protein n=1 Tax=Ralstonia sp. TaxID=54061 RepID=UPI00397C5A4D
MMLTATHRRRRDLARIHILAQELGLDDSEYRDVLWAVARVRSSKGLDAHGRETVIKHLQERRQKQPGGPARPRVSDERRPLAAKVCAQQDALGVDDRYVDSIARRICGVDRWTWCDVRQMRKVVAALEYALRRKGERD